MTAQRAKVLELRWIGKRDPVAILDDDPRDDGFRGVTPRDMLSGQRKNTNPLIVNELAVQ